MGLWGCEDSSMDPVRLHGAMSRSLHAVDEPVKLSPDLRPAAVIAILFPDEEDLWIPLIKRTTGGTHGGQLALPGGRYEATDESLVRTALREAQEEIGVTPESIEVLGRLEPVRVLASSHHVVPFVAWTAARPVFISNTPEVDLIINMSVTRTLVRGEGNLAVQAWSERRDMPEYLVSGFRLWGATARVVSALGRSIQAVWEDAQ